MKSRVRADVAGRPSVSEPGRPGRSAVAPSKGTIGWLLAEHLAQQHEAVLATELPPLHAWPGSTTEQSLRRMASQLRVFGPVYDSAAAEQLLQELAWIESLTSAVSDHLVLAERIKEQLRALDDGLLVGPVLADVELALQLETGGHLEHLGSAIGSERYQQLFRLLAEWRTAPPFTSKAAKPVSAVDSYLTRASDDVDRRLVEALLDPDPEPLQRVRLAGQVLARAAEAGGRELGRKAAKRVRRVRRLEGLLDDYHAGTGTADFLARVGPAVGADPRHNGFTYGLLYEQELRSAAALRARIEQERR